MKPGFISTIKVRLKGGPRNKEQPWLKKRGGA